MPTLDIFNDDAFSVSSLTDAINNIPFVPGAAGLVVPWQENGITTLSVLIEERDGELQLLNPSRRGGPGETGKRDGRRMRSLVVPHYQYDDAVYADEVQGVRAFGTESEVQTIQSLVNQRQQNAVTLKLDPTLEYQRLGAVKGVIYNADGTVLYNLFDEFGVAQHAEVNFALTAANPAAGALRGKCAEVTRKVGDTLGGGTFTELAAFVGDAFFDALLAHPEVIDSYKNTSMAEVLRKPYITASGQKLWGAFEFGGIVWMNYRGRIKENPLVATNAAHIFPMGVPGLFRTVFAPADYMETVNTMGLPRYTKQWPAQNGKSVHLESQSNPLAYCTRPRVLIKGKA